MLYLFYTTVKLPTDILSSTPTHLIVEYVYRQFHCSKPTIISLCTKINVVGLGPSNMFAWFLKVLEFCHWQDVWSQWWEIVKCRPSIEQRWFTYDVFPEEWEFAMYGDLVQPEIPPGCSGSADFFALLKGSAFTSWWNFRWEKRDDLNERSLVTSA